MLAGRRTTLSKLAAALLGLLAALLCAAEVRAAEPAKKDAEAMLKAATAFFKAHGKDKLLAAVNGKDPRFIKGELYVVVYAMDATILAHPINAALAGKNLVTVPDVDGKLFRKEFIAVATGKGSGWVDYRYLNPKTQAIEPKTAKVERLDGELFLMCGVYKH